VASTAIVIGLTGGIASGKSAVATLLRQRGAAVIDADQLARQVVEPGQPALADIAARFGAEMLTASGQLDRKKLAAVVFADRQARLDLEGITHPRIAAAGQAEIARCVAAGAAIVFYEAPLIVENGLHRAMNALIVVAVAPEVQVQRLMARDRSTEGAARARIAAQLPLEQKLAVATWVIDNSGDEAALDAEVARLVAAIEARFGAEVASPMTWSA
jgi:dephospho-CoA kinase